MRTTRPVFRALFVAACCLIPASSRAADANTLSTAEIADGWVSLFDGKTLFGWKATSKADWKVADDAIQVATGDAGLLITTVQFADYVLKLDFRAAKGTNSGIFLRTKPEPKNPKDGCYE